MAEARAAATVPSILLRVDRDGVLIKVDNRSIHNAVSSTRRALIRKAFEVRNRVVSGLWPATPLQIALTGGAVATMMVVQSNVTSSVSQRLWSWEQPFRLDRLFQARSSRAGVFSFGCSVLLHGLMSVVRRYSLRILLGWHGWLWDELRRPSLATIIWGVLVRLTSGRHPMLYAHQGTLPRLPVPSLRRTCERYLTSIKPLVEPAKYEELKTLSRQFMAEEGRTLQRYLYLKSWVADNYVTDWWEKYVYLGGRDSIMINSNYYVLDSAKGTPTPRQTARAAQMLTQLLEARRLIDHEQLEPMVIRDTVPMCMQQYGRMFNTTRIPGHEIDTLEHFPSSVSRHVIVARHGSFYILKLYHSDGTVLSTLELESQLEWIKRDGNNRKDTVDARERALPALTALKRTAWAEARLRFFSSGKNQSSLSRIDTAMCFLVLDDMAPEGDTARANRAFHGLDGQLVWLDKSFSLIVFENGRYAINVEHSWADAPVIGHVMEIVTGHERNTGYAENGCNLRPPSAKQSQHKLKTPSLLEWELDGEEIGEVMDEAVSSAAALIGSLQLQVTTFREFGKGTIKRCKVSPDAFFQLALQMAYREDVGKFDLTYESSMTRLFRGGRTETVRSVTAESVAFVEAMRDPSATREQRLALMNKAADAHQELYRLAMTGGGVDRHLFALYVVSKGKSVQSAFLNEALGSSLWRLSTSQQPQGQASKLWDMRTEEHQAYLSPGGGFGPVADDGYGVSYMLAGENVLFWHVSAKANSRVKTSAENLSNLITKSLLELRELCQPQ